MSNYIAVVLLNGSIETVEPLREHSDGEVDHGSVLEVKESWPRAEIIVYRKVTQ